MMIPEFRDEWTLAEVKPDDSSELWIFRKNIGASEIKGLKIAPSLIYLTIGYQPKDETGLPNSQDEKSLYDSEDEVAPKLEKEAQCVHVGSVPKAGVKDLLFYVSDSDLFLKALNENNQGLASFEIPLEKHEDPNWQVYEDFPRG